MSSSRSRRVPASLSSDTVSAVQRLLQGPKRTRFLPWVQSYRDQADGVALGADRADDDSFTRGLGRRHDGFGGEADGDYVPSWRSFRVIEDKDERTLQSVRHKEQNGRHGLRVVT